MKIKLLVATALVVSSFSPVLVAPAYAVPADVLDELQAVCEAAVRPNPDNSGFETEATGVTEEVGPEFLQSSEVLSSTPGDVLLGQTTSFSGPLRVNGGSPNIHGDFEVVSTYSGGSSETLNTYAQTTTYTFGCRVFKETGSGTIEPPGQQIPYGLLYEDTQVTRTELEVIDNPDYQVTTTEQKVVCISPSTNGSRGNPGVWRSQNGYNGEEGACSTSLYNSLNPGGTPSNSLPSA